MLAPETTSSPSMLPPTAGVMTQLQPKVLLTPTLTSALAMTVFRSMHPAVAATLKPLQLKTPISIPVPATIPSLLTPTRAPMAAVGGGVVVPLTPKGSITPTSIPVPVTTPSTSTPMPTAMAAGGGGTAVAMPIPLASTTTPPSTLALATTPLSSTPSHQGPTPMPGLFAIAPLMSALAMTSSASTPQPSKLNAATTLPTDQKTAPST